MGFILKIVLIGVALSGIGLGNFGLNGDSPESIALGVIGVIAALISVTFLFKFLWRFLGCLSTILIALVIVVILLILTGTFDAVASKVVSIFKGETTQQTQKQTRNVPQNTPANAGASYVPVLQPDGTTVYVPASMLNSASATVPVSQETSRPAGDFVGSISAIRSGSQFFIDDLKVILFGIDTPDIGQICSDRRGRPYDCGQESVRQLRKFTGQTNLNCTVKQRGQNDANLLSAVCTINDYDLAAAMVQAGWAFANLNDTRIYLPYQQEASNLHRGMWSGQFYLPSEWRKNKHQEAKREEVASRQMATSSFLDGLFK